MASTQHISISLRLLTLLAIASASTACNDDINEADSVADASAGSSDEIDGSSSGTVGESGSASASESTMGSTDAETTVDGSTDVDTVDGSTTDVDTVDGSTDVDTVDGSTGETTADGSTTDASTTDAETTADTADTMTTTTSESGGGVCEGVCGTPECGACPDVGQVAIPGGFTVGATEVSNSQYAEFLGVEFTAEFLAGWLPAECGWKTDFTPDEWPGAVDVPVAGVDWCDAWAYCEWSGQRLCGRVGGGPAAQNEVQNPQLNEWFKACSGGGIKNYPYALNYNASACNGMDAGFGELTDVGSLASCVGGYAGIFDMSGNVWEWEDACDPNPNVAPQDQECRQRGGSFYSNANNLRCGVDSVRARNYRNDNLGIRCCDTP
jgi:hypothetical protein